jgi:hypothetical protein
MQVGTHHKSVRWLLLPVALALVTGVAVAQGPPPPPPAMHGQMAGPVAMGGGIGEGKTVKGLPLTADIVVVRDTTLADGNRIHNESQSKIYRDPEGRVRREMGVDLATPMAGAVKHSLIVITDPVTGTRYMLNPANKTARQMPLHGPKPGGEEGGAGPKFAGGPGEVTKEELGTKTVNGLQAEGVRVTRTIPAGTVGNEKAITSVTERWYSNDLQMVVMTTHTDPMMGTVTTKLVNVTQGAPDAALFQVPSDFVMQAGKPGDPMYMPMKPER